MLVDIIRALIDVLGIGLLEELWVAAVRLVTG